MAAMRAVQPLLEEAEAQAGAMRGREWGRLLPLCPQVAEGFRRALERGERRAARAAAPPPPPGAEGPVIEIPAAAAGPAVATPAVTRSVGTQAPPTPLWLGGGEALARGLGQAVARAHRAAPPPAVPVPSAGPAGASPS